MTYRKQYEEWLSSPHLDEEEKKQLEYMDEEERQDAFYRDLEFGTAGMRGRMGTPGRRVQRQGLLGESEIRKEAFRYKVICEE